MLPINLWITLKTNSLSNNVADNITSKQSSCLKILMH